MQRRRRKTDVALAPEECLLIAIADDETAIVERGRILIKPLSNHPFPRRRQQMCIVSQRLAHLALVRKRSRGMANGAWRAWTRLGMRGRTYRVSGKRSGTRASFFLTRVVRVKEAKSHREKP